MTDPIEAVRALHAPRRFDPAPYHTLLCDGCDVEDWESEQPTYWPCRTARLVYTPEEIEAAVEAHRTAYTAYREKRATQPKSAAERLVPDMWAERIADQISAAFIAKTHME